MRSSGALARTAVERAPERSRPDAAPLHKGTGANELRGEILERDALLGIEPAWLDLCDRCAEDNVYYSPGYAKALLQSVERNTDVRFAVVWNEAQLVGFLPFTRSKITIPLLQAARKAWRSQYTFSCTPVLDRHQKLEAANALIDVLAAESAGEWILPTVNIRGEACQVFVLALENRQAPWAISNLFERAVLDVGSTYDEHMKRHVSTSRRKGLNRNRRRLEELGSVEHRSYTSGNGLDAAVSAFLKIEASGWKGKRGTALACDEWTRKFAVSAFGGTEGQPICRADLLVLNGEPIAVSLIVSAGTTGFAVKCAYDEAYRTYSPGLVLELEVIRSFLSEGWARRLDGATAGAHAIDELWSGRVDVADLTFSLARSNSKFRLSALSRADHYKQAARSTAKRLLGLVRS